MTASANAESAFSRATHSDSLVLALSMSELLLGMSGNCSRGQTTPPGRALYGIHRSVGVVLSLPTMTCTSFASRRVLQARVCVMSRFLSRIPSDAH